VSPSATGTVIPLPHMGVSVEEGTVIEWHKRVGEEVAEGELICEISTDKVDTEIMSPASGTLTKILAEAGDTVAVGGALAELDGGSGGAPATGIDSPDATPRGEDSAEASEGNGASRGVSGEPTPASTADIGARAAGGLDAVGSFDPRAAAEAVTSLPRDEPLASPVARRVAAERGVALRSVSGSGRNGRIRKADVLAAAAAGPSSSGAAAARRAPAPAGPQGILPGYEGIPHEVVATTRVRRAIAEHMIRSRRTAAHMTTEVDVDLSAAVRARAELNRSRLAAGAPKLSFLPFIARATCAALAEHPDMNATFQGEQTIRWGEVNLGVAVDTDAGLLVPVIRNAGAFTAAAIGEAIAGLAARARDRKLAPDDLAGGTFTISNPGSVGAVSAPAIINQPQVAILGIPTIQRRPWVVTGPGGEEMIAIRSILRLAVTFDHRAVDGADATRFAVAVKERLETWGVEAYA
jgi:pyruvate dehydrogenase E2 component (dihydrolipoamide acetyltransferase)